MRSFPNKAREKAPTNSRQRVDQLRDLIADWDLKEGFVLKLIKGAQSGADSVEMYRINVGDAEVRWMHYWAFRCEFDEYKVRVWI